jgi:hypothetical protein
VLDCTQFFGTFYIMTHGSPVLSSGHPYHATRRLNGVGRFFGNRDCALIATCRFESQRPAEKLTAP